MTCSATPVLAALATLTVLLAPVQAPAAAKIGPPGREVHVKTALYEFDYSYPAAAGRITALKAWLDKDAAQQQAEIASSAREGAADAKTDGRDFTGYDRETEWLVVTDLHNWLSLSATRGDYTGGAHPNHGPAALLWDKAANRQVKAGDLFVSKAALDGAIRKPFCEALDRQREEKRSEPVDRKDMFGKCLDPADEVLILGSTDHAHFTRIGVLIGPYEAGPYSDGDYEVTLPVTPALLAVVKPEYRAAFAASR